VEVGRAVGLEVRIVVTDGAQPVGRRIGPALEARDVLAVLQGVPGAPLDLRDRAVRLAGEVLELANKAAAGSGMVLARAILDDGRAWRKFQAICEAQGGMRVPPKATHTKAVTATRAGNVTLIDNRRLARIAKLAGAPTSPAAGLELHTPVGATVERGQPLFTVHAEAPGELAYALDYVAAKPEIVRVEEST
jgi:thymidine phosphorylase